MQVDIFNFMYPNYKITKPIRLIELFAGYGSQALALKYLGVEFEHYRVVEFDKYAIQSYNEMHEKNFETQDITETTAEDLGITETNKYEYIMTYSFPCQDLSLAGKRKGMSDKSTRSGLLWEVERILDECEELPQILLMENVPQVIGTENVEHFNKWQNKLEQLGYKNYHQNLIATDYGIPQTRNRTFMISILGDYNYDFPQPKPLKLKLKDLLEKEVDEKYYLSDKFLNYCTDMTDRNGFVRGERFNPINPEINDKEYTVTTGAGNRPTDNFIIIPEDTKKGYVKAKDGDGVYINRPHQKRGCVQKDKIQTLKTSVDDIGVVVGTYDYAQSDTFKPTEESRTHIGKDISGSLLARGNHNGILIKNPLKDKTPYGWHFEQNVFSEDSCVRTLKASEGSGNRLKVVEPNLRIRKLTPKECFRLMGVKDEDYEKLTCSNSQKYKQAGNSIVVNVLMAIFKEMLGVD